MGGPATYSLQARDGFGNNRLVGGDTWSSTVVPNDGSATTQASATYTGSNGLYSMTYTVPTYSASRTAYQLLTYFTTGGANTLVGNVTLFINGGIQQYAVITGAGYSVSTLSQSSLTSFTVTKSDSSFVVTPNVAVTYTFSLTGITGSTASCAAGDKSVGVVTPGQSILSYRCKVAGTYSMVVQGNGQPINTTFGVSPFTVTVLPGSAADVQLTGLPTSVVAGVQTTYTIQLKDVYGNALTSSTGLVLQLEFRDSGNQVIGTSPLANADITCPTPVNNGNGQYTVTLTARVKDNKSIRYFINGVELVGPVQTGGAQARPVTPLTVLAAAPDSTKTVVQGGSQPSAIAGQASQLIVSIYDQFSNLILDGTGAFTLAVSLQDNPGVAFSYALTGQFYTLTITPTVVYVTDSLSFPSFTITSPSAGVLVWTGTLYIQSAGFADSTSSVSGLPTATLPAPIGFGQAVAGQTLTFRLNAKDVFGNGLSNINPNVAFRCTVSAVLADPAVVFNPINLPSPTVATRATTTAANQGVFTFTYVPTRGMCRRPSPPLLSSPLHLLCCAILTSDVCV